MGCGRAGNTSLKNLIVAVSGDIGGLSGRKAITKIPAWHSTFLKEFPGDEHHRPVHHQDHSDDTHISKDRDDAGKLDRTELIMLLAPSSSH